VAVERRERERKKKKLGDDVSDQDESVFAFLDRDEGKRLTLWVALFVFGVKV